MNGFGCEWERKIANLGGFVIVITEVGINAHRRSTKVIKIIWYRKLVYQWH